MKCTNCGKTVPNTAKVCGYCGHPLKKDGVVPAKVPLAAVKSGKTKSVGMKGWVIGAFGLIVILAAVLLYLVFLNRPAVSQNQIEIPTSVSNVLLYDDFKNPASGWPVFNNAGLADVGYQNGAYRIAFLDSDNFQAGWSENEYGNFIVETVFSVPLGETGIGAGLTIRAEDQGWYMVWIFPNTQEFILVRSVNEQPDALIPRQRSDLLQPQLKDNRLYIQLKVVANSNGFEVWAAQPGQTYQLLGTVNDSALTSGHLGPSANSTLPLVNSPAEVLFDWIKVSRITSSE